MAKEVFGIDVNVLKEIKELFKETSIEEIELEEPEKMYLRISRKKPQVQVVSSAPVMAAPVQTTVAPVAGTVATPAPVSTPAPASDSYDDESKYHKIKSPVIGTYYESSSPGANAFVKLGDAVSPDTTVCIVEAMKVMNEIKADVKGRIVKILKSNEESVQSGEVLFIVEKS